MDPAITLDRVMDEEGAPLRFRALPAGASPAVSAEEAVNIACAEDPHDADRQRAILAVMPAGGNIPADTLVWIVQYDGTCIIPSGPLGPIVVGTGPKPCAPNRYWQTVIDAQTGELVSGYTSG